MAIILPRPKSARRPAPEPRSVEEAKQQIYQDMADETADKMNPGEGVPMSSDPPAQGQYDERDPAYQAEQPVNNEPRPTNNPYAPSPEARPIGPRPDPPVEYYPNGVPKQAMDERLPSGETVAEATDTSFLGSLLRSGRNTPTREQYKSEIVPPAVEQPIGPRPEASAPPEQIPTILSRPATDEQAITVPDSAFPPGARPEDTPAAEPVQPAAVDQPDVPEEEIPTILPTSVDSPEERYKRKRKAVTDLEDTPVKRTGRLKSAALSGLLNLSRAFGHPIQSENDFYQSLAAAGTYFAGGAIDPKLGPTYQRDEQLKHARADMGEAGDEYETDIKNRKAETGIENDKLKPFFEQQKNDIAKQKLVNKVQQDELNFQHKLQLASDKVKAAGNEYVLYVDEPTGQVMMRFPKDSSKKPVPFVDEQGNQLMKPSEQVYDYTGPSGQTVKVKGSEVLRTDVGLAQAAASTENAAEKYNAGQQDDYQQKVTEYENKKAGLVAKSTAAINLAGETQGDLDTLVQQIQGQGYPASPQQQSQIGAMREKIRSNRAQADGFNVEYQALRPPPKPTAYTPKTVTTGKYAGRVFPSPASLKQYFPNLNEDQIRRKVEQNGGKFEK